MKKSPVLIVALVLLLGGMASTSAYGQKKAKVIKAKPTPAAKPAPAESAEPDKILYDKALDFLKHGRYTEARLNFQTLINTYPDSEYLAKAKLGTADSFYKEGGTTNMVQAISTYKEFIVFFPFLDEASYAQMQVGMGHYRMMEKSDRDNSQAEAAEQEFQTFLLKYPQSPLTPKAEQYLRNVQEVLADGEFKIGRFYYLKGSYGASAARFMEVTERYPLYSQTDQALWMLGDVYMRAKQFSKNEDDKNHWADLAGQCYDRILQEYPLSKWASGAKSNLSSMGMAVPPADPPALARMKQQQLYEKQQHSRVAMLELPLGMIKSNPDVTLASRSGTPNLSAPDNAVSATEVLKPGAAGPSFNLAVALPRDSGSDAAAGESTTPVEAVPNTASGAPSSGMAVEIIAAPSSDTSSAPATSARAASGAPDSTSAPDTPAPPANGTSDSSAAPPAAAAALASGGSSVDSAAAAPGGVSGSSGDPVSQASSAAAGDSQPAATAQPAQKNDSKTESSSKKKKGLKKLNPF